MTATGGVLKLTAAGLGNYLAATLCAVATGTRLDDAESCWRSDEVFSRYPSDLFARGAERYAFWWLPPGAYTGDCVPGDFDRRTCDRRHFSRSCPLLYPDRLDQLVLRDFSDRELPQGTTGVTLRLLHRSIPAPGMAAIRESITRLLEHGPVLVTSDAPVDLPRCADLVVESANLESYHHFPQRMESALRQHSLLRQCGRIYRLSPVSTFVDWHWYRMGIPVLALPSAPHVIT